MKVNLNLEWDNYDAFKMEQEVAQEAATLDAANLALSNEEAHLDQTKE